MKRFPIDPFEIDRVGHVVHHLDASFEENEVLSKHYRGLLGPRMRGSTSEVGLEDLLDVHLVDVTADICSKFPTTRGNGCFYFRGSSDRLGGRVKAMPLGKLMAMHEAIESQGQHAPPFMVEVRDAGTHGVDLVYTIHEDWADHYMPRTDEFMIITGPVEYGYLTEQNLMNLRGKVLDEVEYNDLPVEKQFHVVRTWHPGPVMSDGTDALNLDRVVKLEVIG